MRLIWAFCGFSFPTQMMSLTGLSSATATPTALHIACLPFLSFNAAFHSAAQTLTRYFGAPTATGERRLSFRTWPYAYHRWALPEGEFTLVQDEFDIQNGMDVTLWVQPIGTPLEETVNL